MATIFSCEHPVRIRNPYTGKELFVPCRKCDVCKANKMRQLTERLNIESKCHHYTLFGTLTYSPEFLPYLLPDFDSGCLKVDGSRFSDPFEGEFNNFSFDDLNLDDLSYEFLRTRKVLPLVSKSHIQKFLKRLRFRVLSNRYNKSGEPLSDRYVRYFFVGEYGSTLLRPHYHFIIWTCSKWFAEHSKDVIASCWRSDGRSTNSRQLGRVDCSLVKKSASSYVASYVSCLDTLPKVYSFSKFRPFTLSSRCPSIGTLFESESEIRKLFDSGSVVRSYGFREKGEILESLLQANVCDRLYPRIKGFDRLPFHLLRRVYDVGERFCQLNLPFEDFKLCLIAYSDSYYVGIEKEYFNRLVTEDSKDTFSGIHRFYTVMHRFWHQRRIFGVSITEYLNRIIEFYKNRDYYLLCLQMKWRDNNPNVSFVDSLLVDPSFVSSIRTLRPDVLPIYLRDYGFSDDEINKITCSLKNIDFLNDVDFRNRVCLSHKILSDGKSDHEKYEYLNKVRLEPELRSFYKKFLILKHSN